MRIGRMRIQAHRFALFRDISIPIALTSKRETKSYVGLSILGVYTQRSALFRDCSIPVTPLPKCDAKGGGPDHAVPLQRALCRQCVRREIASLSSMECSGAPRLTAPKRADAGSEYCPTNSSSGEREPIDTCVFNRAEEGESGD